MSSTLIIGLLIPFAGTVLGSATVFFLKNEMGSELQKALLGFASGVMMAASVWSLLIPAMDMAEAHGSSVPWLPAAIGFLLGMFGLLILDHLLPHLHMHAEKPEGHKSSLGKTALMFFAVTLHNIPEGMAVGVVLAAALQSGDVSISSAIALTVGIAIQNFPEGAIVSLPLKSQGLSKPRSFLFGAASGAVEPIFGLITVLLTSLMTPILPYLLAFAAGAMIYVVVEELIPEAQEGLHTDIGTIGVALGFALMLVLDSALG